MTPSPRLTGPVVARLAIALPIAAGLGILFFGKKTGNDDSDPSTEPVNDGGVDRPGGVGVKADDTIETAIQLQLGLVLRGGGIKFDRVTCNHEDHCYELGQSGTVVAHYARKLDICPDGDLQPIEQELMTQAGSSMGNDVLAFQAGIAPDHYRDSVEEKYLTRNRHLEGIFSWLASCEQIHSEESPVCHPELTPEEEESARVARGLFHDFTLFEFLTDVTPETDNTSFIRGLAHLCFSQGYPVETTN